MIEMKELMFYKAYPVFYQTLKLKSQKKLKPEPKATSILHDFPKHL